MKKTPIASCKTNAIALAKFKLKQDTKVKRLWYFNYVMSSADCYCGPTELLTATANINHRTEETKVLICTKCHSYI